MLVGQHHYDVLEFLGFSEDEHGNSLSNYDKKAQCQTLDMAFAAVKTLQLKSFSVVLCFCVESTSPQVMSRPGVGSLPVYNHEGGPAIAPADPV